MATTEEMLAMLVIDVAVIKAIVTRGGPGGGGSSTAEGRVATDAELDAKYGNEPIRRNPSGKYWSGASYEGKRLSACPPEYLDALAEYKDACVYMNEKSGDPSKAKYAGYDRRDASLARGWARRLRAGWNAPPAAEDPSWLTDSSLDDAAADEVF